MKSASKKVARYQPTSVQNIYRYTPTGGYYARFKIGGKTKWKSLKTKSMDVAKRDLTQEKTRAYQKAAPSLAQIEGIKTFGNALDLLTKRYQADPNLLPRSKSYYDQRILALKKSWPELMETSLDKISYDDLLTWQHQFAPQYCASAVNNTLSILKRIFAIGIEAGVIVMNPAARLKRSRIKKKPFQLPTPDEFQQLCQTIGASGSGWAKPCSWLVRFLAYSGLRLTEAANVLRSDIDFKKSRIHVRIAKGDKPRTIPMLPEMRSLLEEILAEQPDMPLDQTIMRVHKCQKALKAACEKIGIAPITHHGLRHFFATRCLHNKVDVHTVSNWLGHADGGSIALKIYAEFIDQHSDKEAERVRIGPSEPAVAPPAKPSPK